MGLVAHSVYKNIGDPPTRILTDINLEIRDKEFVSLTGRSGSGKSTLLYLLSSLDAVSKGTVEIDGHVVNTMKKEEVCEFRNKNMGFVFQFHYLISELCALDNVLLPARKQNKEEHFKKQGIKLLEEFGLGDKLKRLPRQLSGGEQQRVALARALIMNPKYLFADEPTGSLDSVNGEKVMNILCDIHKTSGTTIVMVTHDKEFAAMAERQIRLVDGRIID